MDIKQTKVEEVTIRFAGDSGDGMQLSGTQFSHTAAFLGIDVNTFPDYPAEIRAPEGTLYGVSAYSVHCGKKVYTSGDYYDILVAMNASSLKMNLPNLKKGGIIITTTTGFNEKNLKLSGYEVSPLEDNSLSDYILLDLNMIEEVRSLLSGFNLTTKSIDKTKNIFALGMLYYIFQLECDHTTTWLRHKFAKRPDVMDANVKVLQAGYEYAKNDSRIKEVFHISHSKLQLGYYRNITGNEAIALGLVTASQKAKIPLFLGSYPITPATEILSNLAGFKSMGVKTFQAEDEIAGIASAIGAAFGGNLAVTTTSGPGLSLKVEAMGLATMTELPLIIVDVMRAGPSTGIPTKPEQSDLNLAMFGRHGEAPIPILAAATASNCFDMAMEAARIAIKYMVPVMLLSDGYIAQGTQVWKVPVTNEIPEFPVQYATDVETYAPYKRDPETLARPWAIPGTPGLEHRIGGLEKMDITGNQTANPQNHQKMVEYRAAKVRAIANDIPDAEVHGDAEGELLVLTWGSTYGATKTALDRLHAKGVKVSYCHLYYLNPFPKNLGDILSKFDKVLIPEINCGQLANIIRHTYLRDVIQYNMVLGRPFKTSEIEAKVLEILGKEGE